MPLLPKEIEIAPDDLFSLPDSLPWRVAHVRSRQEKTLAREMFREQIPFYLPQIEKVSSRGGRRYRSYIPLFPGYVFFRGSAGQRDLVTRNDVTVRVIDVEDQALIGAELQQIRALQLAGASLIPIEELAPDDPVRITEGPFRGYSGRVVRDARGDRLVVALTLLRKSVAVEIDRAALRRMKTML
jgi:transcription antitermination factor NusG